MSFWFLKKSIDYNHFNGAFTLNSQLCTKLQWLLIILWNSYRHLLCGSFLKKIQNNSLRSVVIRTLNPSVMGGYSSFMWRLFSFLSINQYKFHWALPAQNKHHIALKLIKNITMWIVCSIKDCQYFFCSRFVCSLIESQTGLYVFEWRFQWI